MIICCTLVQSSVPLEDEKEDQVVRDWIYGEEDPINHIILATPISPKRYGKGYQFLKKMGCPRHDPLSNSKNSLIDPVIHTNSHKRKDTNDLGYGVKNNIFIYDEEPPTINNSNDKFNP